MDQKCGGIDKSKNNYVRDFNIDILKLGGVNEVNEHNS
jgi:hypothetical protein